MEEAIRSWLFDPKVGRIVATSIGLLAIAIAARLLNRSFARYIENSEMRYRARKSVTFLAYLAAFLFLAASFSDRLGQFTVAFGVAGAGIAFALQEVIASVAGWVAVSFGGLYRVGDRIKMGATRGDVIDIGVLRTTLMECGEWVNGDLYNGRIVRIANSFVFKEPVYNYSADFPFLWDEIMIPVKYGSDYHLAREILERIANEMVGAYAARYRESWDATVRKYMIENARLEPTVSLIANQNWLEFTLRYVVDYKMRRTTRDRLFVRILEEIDQTGGRVGIAASTLNIEKMPPLDLRIERGREEIL